jgi:hypothetical protein
MPTPPTSLPLDGVLLRTARADDAADLIRVTALDGARPLAGPVLVAEENGAIAAALCLSTGRAVADPFVPSRHLVELLRQHAHHRRAPAAPPGRRRLLSRLAPRLGRALNGAIRTRTTG